jgi:hypothetical protein
MTPLSTLRSLPSALCPPPSAFCPPPSARVAHLRPLLISFLILLSLPSFSQHFEWGRRGGSTNSISGDPRNWNNIIDITTDANDNVYILARVGASNLQVDGNPLVAYASVGLSSNINILISSFTSSGDFRWAKVIGGLGSDYGNKIKLDSSGNVYLAGWFARWPGIRNPPAPHIHIGNDTVIENLNVVFFTLSTFLLKYDSSGSFQWIRFPEIDTLRASDKGRTYRIDVTPDGQVHWFCHLKEGQHTWTTNNFINQTGEYVLVYDSQGEVTKIVKLDMETDGQTFTSTWNYENFVYDHVRKRYYVGGYHARQAPLIIGGDTIHHQMYLAAFDSTGQVLWKKQGQSPPVNNSINDMVLDDEGNLYITGIVTNGTEFNGVIFNNPDMRFNSPFIMKIDSNGKMIWDKYAHVNAINHGNSVVYNSIKNEVAITGFYARGFYWFGPNDLDTLYSSPNEGYETYIARFSPQNGDLLAMHQTQTVFGTESQGHAITADTKGDYYLGGNYSAVIYLGPDTLFKIGGQRSFFLAKYSCPVPNPEFSASVTTSQDTVTFIYTGESADSVVWDFGDGSASVLGDTVIHVFPQRATYHVCVTAHSECGRRSLCDSINTAVLHTNLHHQATNPIKLYPNPTSDHLNLDDLDQVYQYQIINNAGQSLLQGQTPSEATHHRIDIQHLPAGVYVIYLRGENHQVVRQKVVKVESLRR